jgi:hypothetical protein
MICDTSGSSWHKVEFVKGSENSLNQEPPSAAMFPVLLPFAESVISSETDLYPCPLPVSY